MVANNAFLFTETMDKTREEGKRLGREEGERLGREQEKIRVAIQLLDILDNETIALKVGLPIEKVIELRKEYKGRDNH